ncbi:MAG TPA: hypothetical protein VHE13_12700 [Opitutus sp.]|nr:hypothetical protein [Opitutus sp.]
MSTDEYLHRELSEDIIGAAMVVLNKLRPGLIFNFKDSKLRWKRIVR